MSIFALHSPSAFATVCSRSQEMLWLTEKRTHNVALTAAVGTTAYIAKEQTGLDFWLQLAGSALGARCTGNLPDILEPPVSSYHLSTFHSVGLGGTIVSQFS